MSSSSAEMALTSPTYTALTEAQELKGHDLSMAVATIYDDMDSTMSQITMAMSRYTDLKAAKAPYTFPDGRDPEILCLTGTIPMSYQGNTYHTPIRAWLPIEFPYKAPMCYVVPSVNMKLSPNTPNMEPSSGFLTTPAIVQWNARSYLVNALDEFSRLFSAYPPLHSVSTPATSSYPSYQQPSYSQQQYSAQQPSHVPHSSYGSQQGYGYAGHSHVATSHTQPASSSYQQSSYQQQSQPPPAQEEKLDQDMKLVLRMSLEETVTKKLEGSLKTIRDIKSSHLDDIQSDYHQLEAGEGILQQMLTDLNQQTEAASQHLQKLRQAETDLKTALSNVPTGDVDWSTVVNARSPLERQYIGLLAEDAALSDTLYELRKLFEADHFTLEVYLQNVDRLSRKLFHNRLLQGKARQQGHF
eukprot:m.60493 g.60493  ORF g.60493 m.60493 type:complete len:413 (-) comp11820_c0_seq1:483-1721(-)